VDEVGELQRVADEENRRVVAGEVVVAFLGVELNGEAARVAHCVRGTAPTGDCAEAHEDLSRLADLAEESRSRVGRDVLGHFEVAEGARATRVHDALGDALAVEARQFLEQVHVLDEHRTAGTGRLRVLVVRDGRPRFGRQSLPIAHL
jgi:hypothetical protein